MLVRPEDRSEAKIASRSGTGGLKAHGRSSKTRHRRENQRQAGLVIRAPEISSCINAIMRAFQEYPITAGARWEMIEKSMDKSAVALEVYVSLSWPHDWWASDALRAMAKANDETLAFDVLSQAGKYFDCWERSIQEDL